MGQVSFCEIPKQVRKYSTFSKLAIIHLRSIAFLCEKEKHGLDAEDEGEIGVIINTSMSPWLRAQKTFKKIGFIIRNELYNAYGAVSYSLQVQ